MSVRFKFKNDLDFSAVPVDGFHISVRDLKRAIVAKKRLGRVTDFDLDVINQQSDRPYDDEDALISKNSTLVVVRRPLPPGAQKTWEEDKSALSAASSAAAAAAAAAASSSGGGSSLAFASGGGGESEKLTEDDKLKTMMSDSTEMYDQKNWVKYRGRQLYGSKPPAHYTCMKCHQRGHWASECPLVRSGFNGGELKKTTGIPRSFLVPADKNTPGAKINPQGSLVVWIFRRLDFKLYVS